MLVSRIKEKESGLLFYGMTPPKLNTPEDRLKEIAQKQINRLSNSRIDGIILYDLQDESSRTNMPRPFPFMETISPELYSNKFLNGINVPKIIYKSVGKLNEHTFIQWVNDKSNNVEAAVFVGAPSKDTDLSLPLNSAYSILKGANSPMIFGGVTIPERHLKKEDEHLRVIRKTEKGCSFFVSQCIYNLDNTKNFLSDYHYELKKKNQSAATIIFTLTPCGSLKTLQFMSWLGIDIPKWLCNDLNNTQDVLGKSVEVCKHIARELIDYCKEKNIPYGFNIESVAVRKAEIEASIDLLKYVGDLTK